MKKYLLLCIMFFLPSANSIIAKEINFSNPFAKDPRAEEIKYQYNVLKDDEKYNMEKRILDLFPSGYMTVDEYEQMSEYKDRSNLKFVAPTIETPSDFKYVPKPLYRIVKYNDPPGSVELSLGKTLYLNRQINGQGIVSPDFTILVYPAVYYYSDSASVASDMFVIPLDKEGTNLNKILTANTAKRLAEPILSTDKAIDNYAAFRTLTPVDFSSDGSKLLIKQKIGSREDGIWETRVYVYDFVNKLSYDLSEVRDAVVYFWEEYMKLNLDDKRWDIYPIGFDKTNPERIIVQGFAFTGEKPVFLGTWSVDWKGNQSRIESFDKNMTPSVSVNGYKVIKDGVEDFHAVEKQEKNNERETKYILKRRKSEYKETIGEIKEDYKYNIRSLNDDYKEEYRDYKKLRSLAGTTENEELQAAYRQYLIDQYNKDLEKTQKKIDKQKKNIEKIDAKLDILYEQSGESSKVTGDSSASENDGSEGQNQVVDE